MTLEEAKVRFEENLKTDGFRYWKGAFHMECPDVMFKKLEWGKKEDGQNPECFCAHFTSSYFPTVDTRIFGRLFQNNKGHWCVGEFEVWTNPEHCVRIDW